jgi:transposase InsO family protein
MAYRLYLYPHETGLANDRLAPSAQYTARDWLKFLKAHRLEVSMSRRGNCHDNAVAESFFL